MNILFDFITTHKATGAGEYVRRVFFELLEDVQKKSLDVNLYAVWDSKLGCAYKDLSKESLKNVGVECFDIQTQTIDSIVNTLKIDKLFIGCGQYWGTYAELANLGCEVICVIHDVGDQEFIQNDISSLLNVHNIPALIKHQISVKLGWSKSLKKLQSVLELIKRNGKVQIIAVSEYTKYSIYYTLGIDLDRIKVFYSPERILSTSAEIENEILRNLIKNKEKYLLMVSANRASKNPQRAVNAFKKFAEKNKDLLLVTLGYPKSVCDRHLALPFLSESDLTNAFKNCNALFYPSFLEGFGYPPFEVMKFGKPVLCSNVSSLPELLENTPIYFSPFYETDMYKALNSFVLSDYEKLCETALMQYKKVSIRQSEDLKKLLSLIEQ